MFNFVKEWFFCTSSAEDYSISFYRIFLVLGIALYSVTGFSNMLLNMVSVTIILPFVGTAFLIFNHFVFYKRGKIYLCRLLSVIYNNFIFSTLMWLTNSGLKGGFQYFVFLFIIFTVMMLQGKTRNIIIVLYTGLITALMFFELKYPEIISELSKIGWNIPDMMIGMIINMLVISFAIVALLGLLRNEQKKIIELSTRDALTRQYNRRFIMDTLHNMYKNGSEEMNKKRFVVFIDVDDFKQINDKFGHAEGDKLLIGICDSINENIREEDYLARIGGDEFLMIIHTDTMKHAGDFVKRLVKAIEKDNNITVSAGLTTLYGKNSVSELLEKADDLMYLSKKTGKNRVSIATD